VCDVVFSSLRLSVVAVKGYLAVGATGRSPLQLRHARNIERVAQVCDRNLAELEELFKPSNGSRDEISGQQSQLNTFVLQER
jgi:hypothetical protein